MAKNDPYNSNYGDRNAPVKRAMKSASKAGVDPRNSHDVQSKKWKKAWTDKARRTADKDAKNAIGQSTAKKYDGNM